VLGFIIAYNRFLCGVLQFFGNLWGFVKFCVFLRVLGGFGGIRCILGCFFGDSEVFGVGIICFLGCFWVGNKAWLLGFGVILRVLREFCRFLLVF